MDLAQQFFSVLSPRVYDAHVQIAKVVNEITYFPSQYALIFWDRKLQSSISGLAK
jgi:hypothetical protein